MEGRDDPDLFGYAARCAGSNALPESANSSAMPLGVREAMLFQSLRTLRLCRSVCGKAMLFRKSVINLGGSAAGVGRQSRSSFFLMSTAKHSFAAHRGA